jgi:tetratricopeptide (TPR) repeat protein
MLDCQLYGLHPSGHHLSNVLLHIATVSALFLVLRRMTGAFWRSAFVAAVFAIHPLRVESVAWVAERKDVLSGLFFMLTLGAYVRYARRAWSWRNYGLVIFLLAMGLMCKPMLVTLPVVLLLLDYWPLHRVASPGRLVMEKLPLLALSAGSCVLTLSAQNEAMSSTASISLPLRLANALATCMIYPGQMVWPAGLAVYYPFPRGGLPPWEVALAGTLLAGISAAAWAQRRKQPWLLMGWAWYLVMLLPVIGIIQVGGQAHADRYTYLPQIGIYVALTWLAADLRVSRMIFGSLMAGVLAVLMVCGWKQTAYWQDSQTLWRHTLACTTGNDVAHLNLGADLARRGDVDEAITHYRKALETNPGNAQAHFNLGNSLRKKASIGQAIAEYQMALEINPHHAQACNNLGTLLFQEGQLQDALTQFQKALEIQPDYAEAHYNLGLTLHKEGHLEEAIAHYEKAAQIQPNYAECHYNLGNVFDQQGRLDEAIVQFQQALGIKPGYADAEENLGNAFLHKGNGSEAITHFQKALELEPLNPSLQSNLAWLLAASPDASQRDGHKAVELARQANRLTGGTNSIVLHALAAALAEDGRFFEALDAAQRALHLAEEQSNPGLAGQLHLELSFYQAGSPFHLPAQSTRR